MHETLQRRVCRVAFVVLCVLPTAMLVVWVGWRLWPGRHDARLASLGRQVGGRLTAERIWTPQPGVWRVDGLTLADPETAVVIAHVDWFEFRTGGRVVGRGGELRVSEPGVVATNAARLLRHDLPGGLEASLKRLTLGEGADRSAWDGVGVQVLATTAGNAACGRRLRVTQPGAGTLLQVDRLHTTAAPATTLQIDTGGESVAWRWLAALGGAEPAVDDDSRFHGRLEATLTEGRATCTASGALTGVRPAAVLGHGGLELAAPMRVDLDRLVLSDGRLLALQAACTAAGGAVEHRLVLAAAQRLGCQPTALLSAIWPRSTSPDPIEPLRFNRLAFSLSIDADGCRISGGPVLASAEGPLLLAPARGPAPIQALAHLTAFAPERYQPEPVAAAVTNRPSAATIR